MSTITDTPADLANIVATGVLAGRIAMVNHRAATGPVTETPVLIESADMLAALEAFGIEPTVSDDGGWHSVAVQIATDSPLARAIGVPADAARVELWTAAVQSSGAFRLTDEVASWSVEWEEADGAWDTSTITNDGIFEVYGEVPGPMVITDKDAYLSWFALTVESLLSSPDLHTVKVRTEIAAVLAPYVMAPTEQVVGCARHGGPWGADETCGDCTDEAGWPIPFPVTTD